MPFLRPAIIALILAGVPSACTPMRWERPSTDDAITETDRRECMSISRRQAQSVWPSPAYMPAFRTVRDHKGRVRDIPVFPWYGAGGFPPYGWGGSDQLAQQKNLFDRCMEAKGYRLVPVAENDDTGADATAASPGAAAPSLGVPSAEVPSAGGSPPAPPPTDEADPPPPL